MLHFGEQFHQMSIETPTSSTTSLHRNPFHVIGATTRDNRARVIELADDAALVGDPDESQKAQSALLNLRSRLAAEMSWLPGVAPRKAAQVVTGLAEFAGREVAADLAPLARANVLSGGVEMLTDAATAQEAVSVLYRLALAVEMVELDGVLRDINEDRSVASFPPVRDLDLVAEEFEARKAHYKQVVTSLLDRFPSKTLVKIINAVVQKSTKDGSEHAPVLIQDVVAAYEFGLMGFMETEMKNVETLNARALALAPKGEELVTPVIEEIKKVAVNFNEVVGPIQIVSKTNGIDHAPTRNLAIEIRSLSIDLHNNHGFIDTPSRITQFLNDNFAFSDAVAEHLSTDVAYLKAAEEGKRKLEEDEREFQQAITYSAEIGAMFKDKVSISPAGISWKNNHITLESVTRIRWGGTRHSLNGIPTGTAFMISVGDNRSSFTIDTRKSDIYANLVDRIWRAVGVRLLIQTVNELKAGSALRFGNAIVRDDGVTLIRHKVFGSNEPVNLTWREVHTWSQDGNFFIGARADKKVYVGMSYQNDENIPVLENLIAAFFKTGGDRVSSLFD